MSYKVELETRARKEFFDLPEKIQELVLDVIDDLREEPRPSGAKKLIGKTGYRVRKGSYRILYAIDDRFKIVRVYRIGHRREVYR